MKFTVLGSTGFVGGAMARFLRADGIEVYTPPRTTASLRGENLGHVIYSIGLTGNFRQKTEETIEAHVHVLRRLMEGATFDSWLYLSSTRLYAGLPAGLPATEDVDLRLKPGADGIYDFSKLLGESICLANSNDTVRVARLSNVYGAGQSEHTFLGSVVRDVVSSGKTILNQSPESSKDYVSIDDVTEILKSIAIHGQERLYNIASGRAVTHGQLADIMRKSGYGVEFSQGASTHVFPSADITKIKREFGNNMRNLVDDLPHLLEECQKRNERL